MFKNLLKVFNVGAQLAEPAPSPQDAQHLIAAGNAAENAGRLEEARAFYEQAVAAAPQLAAAHINLGIAAEALGDTDRARACYEQVLAIDAGDPFGAYNLAKLEYLRGRFADAERLLRAAISRKPDFHEAWLLLSNTLDALGNLPAAAAAVEQALQRRPESVGALYNQAGLLQRLGRLDDAAAAAERATTLDPTNVDCAVLHMHLQVAQGFAAEALITLRHAIGLAPHRFDLRSKELFLLNLLEGFSAQEVFERHRALGQHVEASVTPVQPLRRRADDARLRVGFVSGDLRAHPVALFLLPLLERRNRARFEVYCYSSTEKQDHITQQVRALSDRWIDAATWSDAQLTDVVAADGIDILLDLTGHTSGVRLGVFAARPAAVQMTWLGYLNTSGLSRMDYRITDASCDPPDLSRPVHTEQLLFLPASQWCYRPFVSVLPEPTAPCERNGFVTFGSFNNGIKITPEVVTRWGRLLQAMPTARLRIADVGSQRKRESILAAISSAGGAAAERVEFIPRLDLEGYYRAIGTVDIALDSYPYGGGTTTFDALWMGVPVVAASGPMPASRSAASILAALDLQPWVAPSVEDYVTVAIERAADVQVIAGLRRGLRERLRASPLMDESAFVTAFESLLESAWRARAEAR